jgi:hypothetical protein
MRAFILLFAATFTCRATNVPGISFEELTKQSDRIVTGKVLRSTTSWGSQHKYIWTRYEISVSEVLKGSAGRTVIVSEPGGQLDGRQMRVAGAVIYTPGERVALFLKAYGADNRTVGWAQGKFEIDGHDRVHPAATAGSETVSRSSGYMTASTPLARLDGTALNELRKRVRAACARRGQQ